MAHDSELKYTSISHWGMICDAFDSVEPIWIATPWGALFI